MKKLLIIALMVLGLTINAQEQQALTHLKSEDIRGIYKAGNKAICISFSEYRDIDNKNLYAVNILGDAQSGRQIFAVDPGTYLVDVVTNSKTAIAMFYNASEESIELISFDENAKIVSQSAYKGDVNDLESYGTMFKWVLSEANVLFVVRNYSLYERPKPNTTKLVNQGYQLLALSPEAKVLGSYAEDGMNKPASDIKTIVPFKEGCVLFVSQSEYKKKTFSARMEVYSNTAVQTGNYPMSGIDFTYYPTDIKYSNGEIVAAGLYFKGLWFNAKTSEGLFFLKLNTKGEKLAANNLTWADLKTKAAPVDKSDFMFNGKTDFLVESIEATPTGFVILGESYSKSSGVSTAEFILDTEDNSDSRMLSIYDFIAIETDKNGIITSVKNLKKENSNIRINGGVAMMRNVELSFLLKHYNKFPFQSYRNNEIHFISYKNNEGFYSVMDYKTGAIKSSKPIKLEPEIEVEVNPLGEEMVANSGTLSKLDKFAKKMDNVDKKLDALGNKLDYAVSKTDVVFSPGQRDMSGVILIENNNSVYYIIHPETNTVYYLIY